MILTCPSCATSYFTPDEAIGQNGRRVRCKACAHTWHASLSDEPLELSDTPAYPTAQAAQAASGTAPASGFGKREEPPESLAETPAPELPKAFRARAEQQRRIRRAATHGAVWAGLASVFVAILGAAWLFRVEVVDLYPRAAAAYAAVGSPVNPIGLQFEAMGAKPSPNDPDKVLVSGALRNVRDREVTAPPVRVALLDAHGAEIGHALVVIDAAPVLPGGVQGFAAVIVDPGARGVSVGADFVAKPKPARDAGSQSHGGPAHAEAPAASPHADASREAHAVPGPPSGLRPAISAEINAPRGEAPIDARPVDAKPVAPIPASAGAQAGSHHSLPPAAAVAPLDSGHGGAVSASHHG